MQIKKLFVFFIASIFSFSIWCTPKSDSILNIFLETEQKIKQGKIKSISQIPNKLYDFSLFPYLELGLLQYDVTRLSKHDIINFYNKYPGQPITLKLNYTLTFYLSRKNQWQDLIDLYQPNQAVPLQCLYLTAKNKVAPDSITEQEIADIWLIGDARPKECDALFQIWLDKKVIDDALLWHRIYLAMDNNRTELVMHLGKYLPVDEFDNLKLWRRVHLNPELINQTRVFNRAEPFHQKIIAHGLKRIADKNIDKSLRYFRELNLIFHFNNEVKYDYYQTLAKLMFLRDHELTETIISEIPVAYYNKDFHEIAIKSALKNNNWKSILQRINSLPLKERLEDIWIYWQARAYQELNNPIQAKNLYLSIVNKTNYYGLMACNNLKQFCPIEFTITKPFAADKAKLLINPSIQRAITLYKLHRVIDARLEWNYAINTLNEKQQFIAANIADELNWYDRSIVTVNLRDKQNLESPAPKAKNNTMLHLKYPLGYQDLVMKSAKKFNIDPAWIFAISRQESHFVKDAKSRSGAIGLMQLMPNTAKLVAKNYNIPYSNQLNLLTEHTNINLGTAYLQKMLSTHNGNPVLATAAYNAGPGKVKQWTANINKMPTDVWIELVPYKETRNYLKVVVTNTAIYRSRLGKPANQLSDIFPNNVGTNY